MLDFVDWQNEKGQEMISEAKGVTQNRIAGMKFVRGDERWVGVSWNWYPRYENKVETPEFINAVRMVGKNTIGQSGKAKGLVVLRLDREDEVSQSVFIGKFTVRDVMPPKIENEEMRAVGFDRFSAKTGGKTSELQKLNAGFFLKGAKTTNLSGISHYVFIGDDAMTKLKERILSNMESGGYEVLKNPAVLSATKKFLDSDCSQPFDWDSVKDFMSIEDKEKFSIHLISELLYPFPLWNGVGINGFPGFSKCRYFVVPASSSNPAYDSMVFGNLNGGGLGKVKVSSKSEGGARYSAMGMLKAMTESANSGIPKSNQFLVKLLPYVKRATGRDFGRQSVAPFATKECLGLNFDGSDLCKRLCDLDNGKLSQADMKKTEEEVNMVFMAIKKTQGVLLPNTKKHTKLPLEMMPREAQAILVQQNLSDWKKFGVFIPYIMCRAVEHGLNEDTSDFTPPVEWQLNLKTRAFIETGVMTFEAKQGQGSTTTKIKFDSGKSAAKDACRSKTWIGVKPL